MKPIYKYLPFAALASLTLLQACDTTEDLYEPGDKSRIKLAVSNTALQFGADAGAEATFEITSTVSWTIECNDSHFTFSTNSGKGNGSVTVTAQRNSNLEVYRSSFQVIANNAEGLDIDQTVSMEQNIVLFPDALTLDGTTYPEEGGEHTISNVLSTINWMFEAQGAATGLTIDPGFSGPGRYRAFDIALIMAPNYDQQERTVTLEFLPASEQDQINFAGKLPAAFTLTQAAGTLPKNLALTHGDPGLTEVGMTLKFDSKAPIDSCGVVLNGRSYRAPLADADAREVTWTVSGLKEGERYTAVPFVVSKVGRTDGEEQSFYMNATVKVPRIAGVTYVEASRMVTANVSFEGDVAVTNVGLEIYESKDAASPIVTYTSEAFSLKEGTKSVSSTEFMTPNRDYWVRSFIKYNDGGEKTIYTDPEMIHTLPATPGEDDNQPIE